MKKNNRSSKNDPSIPLRQPHRLNALSGGQYLRREAEAKLSKRKQKKETASLTEADTLRLIHELEVHQVELEMQNDELMQARAVVEVSLRQYEDLYINAPIGYMTLARDGTIHQINLSGANLLELERDELIKQHFKVFVAAQSQAAFNTFLEKVFESGQKETCEAALQKDRWVQIAAVRESRQECWATVVDITTRKQAEDYLLQANQLLALAQRSAAAGIWDWDITTGKLNWSTEFFDLFGLDPATTDATFDAWRGVLHPDDVQTAEQYINDAIRDHMPLINEYRIVMPSTEMRWIGAWGNTAYNERGEALRMTGICIDITARKRAQEQLQHNEQVLRLFVENSPAAIAMFDRDMKYIIASRRYLIDYDLGNQDVSGRSHYEIFPEIPEHWKDIHRRCLAGATETADEDPFPRANGDLDWVRWEIRPWYETSGKIGGIILFSEVITARKQAEEALRESQQRFSNAFEFAPIGMALVSLAGRWLKVNRAVCNMLGYSKEELLSTTFQDLTHPDDLNADLEYVQKMLNGKLVTYEMEKRYFHKSGAVVWALLSVSLVKDEYGKPQYLISQIVNITERKQAEEALRESEQNLRMLFETMSEGIALNEIIYDENREMVDYRILNVNPAFYSTADYRGKEVIGNVATKLYGMSPEFIKEFWKQHKNKNSIAYTEMESPLGNRYFFVATSPFVNDRFVTSFFDITDRRRMEKALRESEEKFQKAFYASPVVMSISSMDDGKFMDANAQFFKLTELTPEQVIGHKSLELEMWREEQRLEIVREMQEHGFVHGKEVELITKSGRVVPLLWYGDPVIINGKRCLIVSGYDLTERKQAEDALREREARLKTVTENTPDTILQVDRNGSIIFANRLMPGLTSEEVIGSSIYRWVPEKQYPVLARTFDAAFSVGAHGEYESLGPGPHGEQRIYYVRVMPVIVDGKTTSAIYTATDITERKQAEEALRDSEERLQDIIFSIADWVWEVDEKGVYTYSSQKGFDLFGSSREDIIGKTPFDFMPSDEAERVSAIFSEIKANREPIKDVENWNITQTGEKICLLTNGVPMFDKEGNFKGYRGVDKDITKRKQIEAILNNEQGRIRTILDTVGDPIFVKDNDYRIILANRAFCEIFGLDESAVIGKTLAENVPENERQNFLAVDRQVLDTGIPDLREESLTVADFTRTIITKKARFIENTGKRFLVGSIHDITERKQAEETLLESEAKLKLSQQVAHVGHWTWDTLTNQVTWSDEMKRIFGLDPDTFDGDMDKIITEAIHPDDREKVDASNASVLTAQKPVPLEYRIIWRDGSVHTVWAEAGEKIMDANGNVAKLNGIVQDITERKRAEEEVLQLNANLEKRVEERTQELRDAQEQLVRQEKLAVLGQLAGSVGHELRNPMGVISNAVYFLKMAQPDADEKVKEYLDLIEKHIHISDMIIADLLDFTRIKSADREPVSVSKLIQQTLERFPAPESIEVILDLPADLPQIHADPQQIIQILGNLTLNACQAMKDGGKLSVASKQLSVKTGPLVTAPPITDHWILITVRDTGSGISPENMKKLFEPLFTTKTKGIGLGLAVSKKLIEANGGRIEVESEVGVGSTFSVYLPIYKEA